MSIAYSPAMFVLAAGLLGAAPPGPRDGPATLPADVSDLGQMVRLIVSDGVLTLWGAAEPSPTNMEVRGLGQVTVRGTSGYFNMTIQLGAPDATNAGMLSIRQSRSTLSISCNKYDAQGRVGTFVSIVQGQEGAKADQRLRVTARTDLRTGQTDLTLKSVTEVRRNHAEVYRQSLAPLWRDLGRWGVLWVDEDLASDILNDTAVDEALRRQVGQLLAELDADDFARRESAQKKLRALGRPAMETLQKMESANLTVQQQAEIQTTLQSYRGASDEQRQRLASDADFLVDCLYSRNPNTRKRAVARVTELAGRPIRIDATLAPTELAEAIEALRDALVVGKAQVNVKRP